MLSLASYLLKDDLLNKDAIPSFIACCEKEKTSLITHLVNNNILSSETILSCLTKYFTFPVFDLSHYEINLEYLPVDLILRYRILPLKREQNNLYIGITDPTDQTAISAIQFHTGLTITPMLVSEYQLTNILATLAPENTIDSQLKSALAKMAPAPNEHKHEEDDGPVSEFANNLIESAISQEATDIHIEPFANHCRIRFRCDGLLSEIALTPPHFANRLITRLKILAHLDIAERRLPQDGRLRFSSFDIRMNTCPTLHGEKIVLRMLNANKLKLDIHSLGFTPAQKELFISRLTQPQGLILVTGPTGSGKTITLYSALHYLNQIEKNISSVEDPVEIEFAGMNQINVNPRIGLDFANVLRALLRQDPDIIMVGEIRDKETAEIAMQAAQTGHLVLSTLHTNSAIETILRLQSMGIAPQHFINSVSLIIAQRLVRKINKNQGYKGRTGIFECLPITDTLGSLILSGTNSIQLNEAIKNEKYMSLREAGMKLVQEGITNHEEIQRILGNNT